MGIDKDDVLRQAGYSDGDVLLLTDLAIGGRQNQTVTSSNYQFFPSVVAGRIRWDRIAPADTQLVARLSLDPSAGSGETLSVRIQNTTDSETVGSPITTSDVLAIEQDWVDYNPSTTSSIVNVFLQAKSEPATNNSNFRDLSAQIGVRL